ncbi:MAG: hypothetical protein LLF84_06795 [Methanoregulaceae archaeon]|nr:hypothetical protein [Methanoregulaceae archaeon]
MYPFIEQEFPALAKYRINWKRDEIAYEFAALSLLLIGARRAGWEIKIIEPYEGDRFDVWSTVPKHGYATFGSRSRRVAINKLATILQPKFLLEKDGKAILIYYQGFPPLDDSSDRPDWVLIKGSYKITRNDDRITLEIDNGTQYFSIQYDTLLTKSGPTIIKKSGDVTVLGIIEASTNKTAVNIEEQIGRYKKRYSPKKIIAILGNEVKTSIPVIHFDNMKEQKMDIIIVKSQEVFIGLLNEL